MNPAHTQQAYAVRLDWGPTGAVATSGGAGLAVVVDVLSFTTTLTVACARGVTVLPFAWKDERAAAYAAERDATLALGRLESRSLVDGGGVAASLSPSVMLRATAGLMAGPTAGPTGGQPARALPRIVLPSPNGSSICFGLRDTGVTVVGASLRNRAAVVRWLLPRLAGGETVAVVAAGERWPDGSLRPAVEDLWGAGAVLAALADLGARGFSPEALVAAHAFRAVAADLDTALADCAGGRELVAADFAGDVTVAAELDADDVVPVLAGEEFWASRDH